MYDNSIIASSNNEDSNLFLRQLSVMLNIRQEVIDGTKSDIEANVQVSEYVAKQYIYPTVGEPTQEQKNNALNKILKKHNDDMKGYDPNKVYE